MTPADRFEDLFVRYWDGALTPAEADAFDRLLGSDPAALANFQHLCLQVTVAADRLGPPAPALEPSRRAWTRRRVLAAVGLAVSGAAGALALRRPASPAPTAASLPGVAEAPVVLTRVAGTVLVRAVSVAAGFALKPGDTIATDGFSASAVLTFPDGTAVQLGGGTIATLTHDPVPRLLVERGILEADVPRSSRPFTLQTGEATTTALGPARMALGRDGTRTAVGVYDGRAQLTEPGGRVLLDVADGEVGHVSHGRAGKEVVAAPPLNYAWDPARPLPAGWEAGTPDPDGPSFRAALYHDVYAKNTHYQVRSNNTWMTGMAALYPDSVISVRYKVNRAVPVMSMVVVRPCPLDGTHCAVLYHWQHPDTIRVGDWHDVTARAAELNQGPDGVKVPFGPPWTVTLAFVASLEEDVGLKVARFEIARPESVRP